MVHLISRNMPGPKPTDELTDMAGVRQDRNLMEYLFAPSYCTQYTRKKCMLSIMLTALYPSAATLAVFISRSYTLTCPMPTLSRT